MSSFEFCHFRVLSFNLPPPRQSLLIMPQNAHKQTPNNKKANASNSDRTALILFLTQNHKNGVLNRGITKEAANKFPIFGERQIRRIWNKARPSVLDSSIVSDYFTRKAAEVH